MSASVDNGSYARARRRGDLLGGADLVGAARGFTYETPANSGGGLGGGTAVLYANGVGGAGSVACAGVDTSGASYTGYYWARASRRWRAVEESPLYLRRVEDGGVALRVSRWYCWGDIAVAWAVMVGDGARALVTLTAGDAIF